MRKKPSYFLYKGFTPVCSDTLRHSKTKHAIRIFVWPSRRTMQKATWGNNQNKKRNKYTEHFQCYALFSSKYKKYSGKGWIGDIHFYKQKVRIDWIAHEVSHAIHQYFYLVDKKLNPRTNELFAAQVGSMTEGIYAYLLSKKVRVVFQQ